MSGNPIYRIRACGVCLHQEKVLLVEMRDPGSGNVYVFPPGGEVEKGETPATAAVREVLEETGYFVEVVGGATVAKYPFVWAGKKYLCETHFYQCHLSNKDSDPTQKVNDSAQVRVFWAPRENLKKLLGFCPPIQTAVLRALG